MRHQLTGPGPGRPKGSPTGRTRALIALDAMLAEEGTQEALSAAFKAEFAKNPVRFFRRFVMPLLPKQALAMTETAQGSIRWVSFLETFPALTEDAPQGPLVDH